MDYEFTAVSKIFLKSHAGTTKSSIMESEVMLMPSENLDKDKYYEPDGMPNKEGVKAITYAFIVGLTSNMRYAAMKGYMKEGDIMKFVVDSLEKAFVTPHQSCEVGEMKF